MLKVARDVAGREHRFTATEVASVTNVPYSTTHRLLRRLELLGLVDEAARDGLGRGQQECWFERNSHEFWGAVEEFYSSFASPSEVTHA
jgi:predicted transcriptional regulator